VCPRGFSPVYQKRAFYFVHVSSGLDYSDPVGWFGCYVVGILSLGGCSLPTIFVFVLGRVSGTN